MLQVLHNCVLVLIHGLEAHLVSQEDPEEEEEEESPHKGMSTISLVVNYA